MRFDGESEYPVGPQNSGDRSRDRREIEDVDEDVRRDDEVVAVFGFGSKEGEQIDGVQAIVNLLCARLRDHRRRDVDAGDVGRERTKCGACKPGSAAKIEHALKCGAGTHAFNGVAKLRRRAVCKLASASSKRGAYWSNSERT